jgi:endonuclease YncB( thermonuclease family)
MDPTRPDWQIGPPRRRPRTLWSDLGGLWHRYRGLPVGAQLVGAVVAIVLVIAVGSLLTGGGRSTNVATRSTTTRPLPTLAPTTTLPPLPPGDDTAVKSVIDGDSFETITGVKVRFIGIDAPDVETDSCFSAEATSHLRDLLPVGKSIRLVYDVTKTDSFGRTLAYVYRLPDGLFINVAQVRDGFAIQQASQTNVVHNDEIAQAAADAKAANRGLWQACPATTTTARRPATTSGTTATTAPPATAVTTTTSTTLPASTTSSSVVSSSTSTTL